MASANHSQPNSKVHDEESDHVGSGANTPPGGAATPNPSLQDKRLPQLSNYFAQVRDSLRTPSSISPAPSSNSSHPATMDREVRHDHEHDQDLTETQSAHGLPTAPSSPTPASLEAQQRASRRPEDSSSQEQSYYPTPPLSTSSSMNMLSDAGSDRSRRETRTSPRIRQSGTLGDRCPAPPSQLRKNTLTSNTLSNVVTAPSITAHISNPATSHDSSSPSAAACCASLQSSQKEERRLTKNVSRSQNTPPQTPRALSHESRTEDAASVASSQATAVAKASRSSSSTSNTVVNQIKGQLAVSIVEGRGLRPSTAPYVVCIFQLNEDISEGAEHDAMDTRQDNEPEKEEGLARGVAMRRIGSGQGKPMSIPGMPSRQSSQTNIAKLRHSQQQDQVTDPQWKHEALL